MAWDFETDPEFQQKLDWMTDFVREKVEPLGLLGIHPYDVGNPRRNELVRPFQREVKEQGLWACHLGPELGGQGYGQVKLGLMNEILGGASFAPIVFGCQAPDTGNAEIIAHYGTPEQKTRYLEPLLENEIVSGFSMTEPQGGSDPVHHWCKDRGLADRHLVNSGRGGRGQCRGQRPAHGRHVLRRFQLRAAMFCLTRRIRGWNGARRFSLSGESRSLAGHRNYLGQPADPVHARFGRAIDFRHAHPAILLDHRGVVAREAQAREQTSRDGAFGSPAR